MKESLKHLNSYFIDHNLFDLDKLLDQCSRDNVICRASERFPHLRILHYADCAAYEKKWSYFSLHCRGVVVDLKNKKLLSIPFFKFFNINETGRVPSYEELQKMGSFEASEKLDGSMGILFYDQETNDFYVTTKGSLESEHGVWATSVIPPQLKDKKLVQEHTLMFEIITNEFRNVIDYEKKSGYNPGLYLIGVRHNISQNLFTYKEVQDFAKQYNLPTIKTYPFNTLDEVMNVAKDLPYSEEGYVLRFDSTGLLVKIKSPEYLRVHRFISKLDDKNLLECMIAGQEKDVIQSAPEEYKNEVVSTIENYRRQALDIQNKCYEYFNQCPKESRKDFALYLQNNIPSSFHKYLYMLLDQKPFELSMVYQYFRKTDTASVGKIEIKSPSVVILVGISGSGKSTLAKKLFGAENVVSSDQCREYILGDSLATLSKEEYWTRMQAVSYQAFEKMHSDIIRLLADQKIAVADATHLKAKSRKKLETLAKELHIPITYIVFDAPEALCIERDALRLHPVNSNVIKKQYVQMNEAMKDLSGKSNVVFITPKNYDQLTIDLISSSSKIIDLDKVDEAMPDNGILAVPSQRKDTILVDMDGTLANLDHRLHLVREKHKNWNKFFEECDKDTPNQWCLDLIKGYKNQGYRVIIVSARTNNVLDKTRKWVDNCGLKDIELQLVRDGNDNTPDEILKQRWLDKSGLKDRILVVVDDRDRVCRMWVREGLQVLNCGQGQVF